MGAFERFMERVLWQSRLLIVVAVVASLLVSVVVFYMSTVDAYHLGASIARYGAIPEAAARAAVRSDAIGLIVDVIDGYLLAAVLIIFALGLYELFISRIDAAERSDFASRLLLINSLEDLKDRLAKVIMLMLIVKFFQYALKLKYDDPLQLLFLAVGIALIGGALYLSSRH